MRKHIITILSILTLVGCKWPEPPPPDKYTSVDIVYLRNADGVTRICDKELGHLIYYRYNAGLVVVPGGCKK